MWVQSSERALLLSVFIITAMVPKVWLFWTWFFSVFLASNWIFRHGILAHTTAYTSQVHIFLPLTIHCHWCDLQKRMFKVAEVSLTLHYCSEDSNLNSNNETLSLAVMVALTGSAKLWLISSLHTNTTLAFIELKSYFYNNTKKLSRCHLTAHLCEWTQNTKF